MSIDLAILSDKMMEILQGGTEEQTTAFMADNMPPLIEEVKSLRMRVQFLQIEKSELETLLDEERGSSP